MEHNVGFMPYGGEWRYHREDNAAIFSQGCGERLSQYPVAEGSHDALWSAQEPREIPRAQQDVCNTKL